jgi:hypothetical protein
LVESVRAPHLVRSTERWRNTRGIIVPDCIQIVIGLVVARSGLQLGYDVLHGNQAEPPTLGRMMAKMEALYPKLSAKTAAAIWSAPHARC